MTTYHLTCDGCGAEVNASETEAHTRNCAGRPTYPDVTLDLSTFQRCGPDGQEDARLLGRLDINGVAHRVVRGLGRGERRDRPLPHHRMERRAVGGLRLAPLRLARARAVLDRRNPVN
jgi:hypothetical protein